MLFGVVDNAHWIFSFGYFARFSVFYAVTLYEMNSGALCGVALVY